MREMGNNTLQQKKYFQKIWMGTTGNHIAKSSKKNKKKNLHGENKNYYNTSRPCKCFTQKQNEPSYKQITDHTFYNENCEFILIQINTFATNP
jgi:hypothetical protein